MTNETVEKIKECAQEVFTLLGNGQSESVYETAFEIELAEQGLGTIRRQVPCPIYYKSYLVGCGYIDILINNKIVIELKTVTKITNKDEAQLRKYLAGMALPIGLLINFNPGLEGVEVVEIEYNGETYC